MTHVYECFPFHDELDLLRIRFEELSSVVTKFIIVEANYTHSGEHKNLVFLENRRLFERWQRQIVHLVAPLPSKDQLSPLRMGAWEGENIQRDFALTWLKRNARPTDIVIFSDADEIMRAEAIRSYYDLVLSGGGGIHKVEMTRYEYYLNNKRTRWSKGEQEGWTNGVRIGLWSDFTDILPNRIRYEPDYPEVKNGGWHFSSLGIPETFQKKVQAYAHQEFNKEWILEPTYITRQAQIGNSVYHGDKVCERCPINDTYPRYILENQQHFQDIGWINTYVPPTISLVHWKQPTRPPFPEVSIVIPTLNHVDDLLKPCIESVMKHTTTSRYEFVIVANGCTDSTQAYIESLDAPLRLLWCDEPLGFTKATNEGIQACTGEFIVLMNNDVQILPSPKDFWLDKLLEPMLQDFRVGLSGPHSIFSHEMNTEFLVFFLACIRRKVFEDIGLLDEIFTPGFGEDMDFCIRAQRAGYKISVVDKSDGVPIEGSKKVISGSYPVWHPADITVEEIPNWTTIHRRNQLLVAERVKSDWAYPVGQIRPYQRKFTLEKNRKTGEFI